MHKEHIGGLNELWLKNGYENVAGGGVQYRDPDGLMRAITLELCRSHHRLAPDGLHFLRRLLERTQDELDALLDLPAGTVAGCETGTRSLPESASIRLRNTALEAAGALVTAVGEQTLAPAQKLVFAHADEGWYCAERVVLPALLHGPPAPRSAFEP